MNKESIVINGVKLYLFTSFDEVVTSVLESPSILIAINAGKINKANDETRSLINRNIGYSDGIGAVKALQRFGFNNACKLPGCELWLKIIERLYKSNKTFYLVGGKQEIIEDVIRKLNIDYKGINIVGYRNGYINSEEEKQALISDIAEKKPDVVFVAMGSPKQELLMEEFQKINPSAIYQGLGGSFDVYTGRFKRAPQWLVKYNLEGPYRVLINMNKTRLKRLWSDTCFMVKLWTGRYDNK